MSVVFLPKVHNLSQILHRIKTHLCKITASTSYKKRQGMKEKTEGQGAEPPGLRTVGPGPGRRNGCQLLLLVVVFSYKGHFEIVKNLKWICGLDGSMISMLIS